MGYYPFEVTVDRRGHRPHRRSGERESTARVSCDGPPVAVHRRVMKRAQHDHVRRRGVANVVVLGDMVVVQSCASAASGEPAGPVAFHQEPSHPLCRCAPPPLAHDSRLTVTAGFCLVVEGVDELGSDAQLIGVLRRHRGAVLEFVTVDVAVHDDQWCGRYHP